VISEQRFPSVRRLFAALLLVGLFAGATGCGPVYDYPGYPVYGYAPYSTWGLGGWGYNPGFVINHPWEEHHGFGHHTQFYHGAVGGGFHGGRGFHGGGFHGGGGAFHGGGRR
jgi:uncharacterized membrane protein YgcG